MTDAGKPFNLRQEIRRIIQETNLVSPHEIADKLLTEIPRERLLAVVVEMLPAMVRTELGRDRMERLPSHRPPSENESPKVRGIRDSWKAALQARVHTGAGNQWKMLADCRPVDFRFAAEERRRMAIGAMMEADRFERWAEVCEEHYVTRFADLPQPVLRALLTGEEQT